MATATFSALLLVAVLVTPVYMQTVTSDFCSSILNRNVTNSNSNFTISVSPTKLSANQLYTVTVKGNSVADILLEAVSNSSLQGTWTPADINCNGRAVFQNIAFNSNNSVFANWTTNSTLNTVNVNALISYGDQTFKIVQSLTPETVQTTTVTSTAAARYPSSTFMTVIQAVVLLTMSSRLL